MFLLTLRRCRDGAHIGAECRPREFSSRGCKLASFGESATFDIAHNNNIVASPLNDPADAWDWDVRFFKEDIGNIGSGAVDWALGPLSRRRHCRAVV